MNNDIIRGNPQGSSEPPRPRSQVRPPVMSDVRQPEPTKKPGPPVTAMQKRIDLPEPEKLLPAEAPLSTRPRSNRLKTVVIGGIVVVIVLACSLVAIYSYLLSPKNAAATETIPVEIVSGMLPGQIADTLEEKGVIRSSLAFRIHARLNGIQNGLQAGNYQLSPTSSTPDIAKQIHGGPSADEIEVLFRPGETLASSKKTLLALGYGADEIDAAFTASYDHPLFEGRPASSDLEGYIFGETHRFVKGTPVEDILERYFDDYYAVIEEGDLVSKYRQQGLSLYEGITLASIIQRESGGDDKAQIAQVFLLRFSEGMPLGSDVTYQYIADKEGNPRDVNYDSPYNTRRYAGLPPGPIASPGVAALEAVANPAPGDYRYFLSGDDNVTYFARTLAEHEANIRNHCAEKCQIL